MAPLEYPTEVTKRHVADREMIVQQRENPQTHEWQKCNKGGNKSISGNDKCTDSSDD